MKTNVNLFIALILCAVIVGALYFLARPSQESLGWSPDEMYGDLSRAAYDGSAFTNATFSGSSNGGGVALSMQGGSLSSRTRVSSSRPITHHQYPISNSPLPISNLQSPISNGPSPIAYMTSGAEYRSFGGGGNGNMGAAGTFRTNTQSPITNSQLPIANIQSPIAYNPSPISNSQLPIANHPSPIANSQLPIANNPSNMFGYELKTTFGTASYETYSMLPTRNNIRGRQNALGFNDSWWKWFDTWVSNYGHDYKGSEGYYFNRGSLESVYEAFIDDFWNSGMGDPPSFNEWLDWYMTAMGENGYYNYGNNTYFWVPVGDIVPLILLALLYVLVLCWKPKFRAQVND